MKTVDDIVAAAEKLNRTEFLRLRKKLDRLERRIWISELSVTATKLREENLTDQQIDRLIAKRRYESRR